MGGKVESGWGGGGGGGGGGREEECRGETVGERGECPLLLGFGFLPLSLGVSFAWYGHIKLIR